MDRDKSNRGATFSAYVMFRYLFTCIPAAWKDLHGIVVEKWCVSPLSNGCKAGGKSSCLRLPPWQRNKICGGLGTHAEIFCLYWNKKETNSPSSLFLYICELMAVIIPCTWGAVLSELVQPTVIEKSVLRCFWPHSCSWWILGQHAGTLAYGRELSGFWSKYLHQFIPYNVSLWLILYWINIYKLIRNCIYSLNRTVGKSIAQPSLLPQQASHLHILERLPRSALLSFVTFRAM